METQIIQPKHPILKDVIDFLIFIDKKDFEKVTQVCYPNTNHCLSLMEGSEIFIQDKSNYTICPTDTNNSYLTGIYKKPIKISVDFPYKEICINFKPFVLDIILEDNISSIVFQKNILENYGKIKWSLLFEISFNNDSTKEKMNKIETFFLSNFSTKLKKINYKQLTLNAINQTVNINALSNEIHKSYRSTHRFFKKGLELTPKEFLQIKKVRTSMDMIFENKTITEITYNLDFSDQSHFIKVFKKFTNLTPLQFRRNVSKVDNTLIWKIEK